MNIQSYIDRKRIAGAREHEGRKTDWVGWDISKCWVAVVGELLDACAYCERAQDIAQIKDALTMMDEAMEMKLYLQKALEQFHESHLEAACQEAEQEAKQ